jgi:hypothetical protein
VIQLASDGSQANDDALNPAISADGHYVAFYSAADNLVSGDANNRGGILVRGPDGGHHPPG